LKKKGVALGRGTKRSGEGLRFEWTKSELKERVKEHRSYMAVRSY